MSYVKKLAKKQLIKPPSYVVDCTQYETIMGSESYGVSSNNSDIDIYGFCIPDKEIIFPHLNGEIFGFGRQIQRFEQYQQHHILDKEAKGQKQYDITIYSVIKYFQLCMENNPNMIDSLFTPIRCVLTCTNIGTYVRENRKLFLHKGSWFKFKGYAYSQIHKMKTKVPEGGRVAIIEQYGYDVKFAYHTVRLLCEVEQILTEHDIDLERNREQLKAIRRGEWTENQVYEYFDMKERSLEELYTQSTLRNKPDENKIKEILINCLEMYFGSIDKMVKIQGTADNILNDIEELLRKYKPIH